MLFTCCYMGWVRGFPRAGKWGVAYASWGLNDSGMDNGHYSSFPVELLALV